LAMRFDPSLHGSQETQILPDIHPAPISALLSI